MNILAKNRLPLKIAAVSVLAILGLLLAVPAFADEPGAGAAAAMGVMFLVMAVVFIAAYVYVSLALQAIANKTNTPNAWWAWVPILQIILMLNIAQKPVWWIILFFIPIVGIVFMIIMWMAIAEAVKKPSWWGILLIVPVIGLAVPGYLAWAD